MLTFLLFVGTILSTAYSTCDKDFQIVCYWGSWSYYRPDEGQFNTEHIDPTLCTTIVYSFFGLNSNLDLDHLDTFVDTDKNGIANITALKTANPCLKVNLAVGGWNEGSIKYSVMAAFEDSRKAFARSVLRVLTYLGFDGIDLDWEYPTTRGGIAQDKANFVALLTEIKDTISPWGLELSIAVPVDQSTFNSAYDVPGIAETVDYVHIMAYDYFTQVSGVTGLSAPLSAVKKTVALWTDNGLPAKQVVLGIPTYARTYKLADINNHAIGDKAVAGEKGPLTGEDGFLAYYEVLSYKTYIDFVEVPSDSTIYAYNEEDWFTYENPDTVTEKVSWVKEQKYGGVMIWSIDTDDFRGKYGDKYPLLTAINKALA